MNNKLTTIEQVRKLSVGDIMKKFPNDYMPEEMFDSKRTLDIDTYAIQKINTLTGIIELRMTGDSVIMLASPIEIGHLHIKPADVLQQNVWWI